MAAELDRRTQLLRGALDTCLLALIDHTPTHAYDLVLQLERHGLPDISYGTVYPLMTRLRRQGLVSEQAQPSTSGPPRKVFHLTDEGRRALREWSQQWHQTTAAITTLLDSSTSSSTSTSTGADAPPPSPLGHAAQPEEVVHVDA